MQVLGLHCVANDMQQAAINIQAASCLLLAQQIL